MAFEDLDDTLTIRNQNEGRMPVPPPGAYVGYFENQHGEQWVYIDAREVGAPMLYGSDLDWEECPVDEPGVVPGVVLEGTEADWLRACWLASGIRSGRLVLQKP